MSGAARIVVNYDLLEQSASSLRSIGEEFHNAGYIRRAVESTLGSGEIADAMSEFSGNWDRKRRDLTEKIKAVEGVVGSVMASFSEQDRQAAKFDISHRAGPMMTIAEPPR